MCFTYHHFIVLLQFQYTTSGREITLIKNFLMFCFFRVFPLVLASWFGAMDLKCTHATTAQRRFVVHKCVLYTYKLLFFQPTFANGMWPRFFECWGQDEYHIPQNYFSQTKSTNYSHPHALNCHLVLEICDENFQQYFVHGLKIIL